MLDASVAGNWFIPDEAQHPNALHAWERIRADNALVPMHFWFEIRNVLLDGERRRRFTDRHTELVLNRMAAIRIVFAPLENDSEILALARRHRLSLYDAAYLELAKRQGFPLATLDGDLIEAARAEAVPLVTAPA